MFGFCVWEWVWRSCYSDLGSANNLYTQKYYNYSKVYGIIGSWIFGQLGLKVDGPTEIWTLFRFENQYKKKPDLILYYPFRPDEASIYQ